jgi:hypothetical protein
MLGYRMLIVAEGNDVATGGKWAMLSGSTVVTTRPAVCSWMGEDRMVPGVHYLEVRRDWEDLEERVEWCVENVRECEDIGRRGRCWMRRFLDGRREREVMEGVWGRAGEIQGREGVCGGGQVNEGQRET